MKSASNVAERRPVSQKAPAKGKAAIGAAFGAVMVKEIEARAEAEVKAQTSLKDRLRELMGLDPKQHDEFRGVLSARVEQINDGAKAATQTLAEYRSRNAVANSIYTMLSVWKSLSLACSAGYEPNLELPWSTITSNATAYKNSTGKPDAALVAERARLNADKEMAPEAKKAALAEVEEKIAASITPKHPDHTTRTGRPETPLIDKVWKLLEGQPLQEVEKVSAWLVAKVAMLNKPQSSRVKTPGQAAAADPNFKPATAKAPARETAEAKGEKRTQRKGRNS